MPHIVLKLPPNELDTENESVAHWEAKVAAPPPAFGAPLSISKVAVAVDGPAMTKVSKSNLSWQTLLLAGQTVAEQPPAENPFDSK